MIKSNVIAIATVFLLFVGCAKSGGDDSASGAKDCGSSGRVTYNGNGATSGTVPGDQCVGAGSIFLVGGNDGNLNRPGFAFLGWNSKADGTGTTYSGSYQALSNGTLTLYAKWTVAFSVTYDGNGQTGGAAPIDTVWHTSGSSVTTIGNTRALVKTGLTFAGWNTKADGTGISYLNGTSFTMGAANITLYARWGIPYTVSYDANGASSGSAPTDSNTYATGINVTMQQNTGTLARTGFLFSGWNTQADGLGSSYAVGGIYTMAGGNATMYARWLALYTITYSGNGNTGGAVPVNANAYTQGASIVAATNTLSRDGYSFGGWNTQADGTGTNYSASSSFAMPAANLTLYANWTRVNKQWTGIAASSDGSKLAATVYGGQIFTSSDSGGSWIARDSSRNWRSVASSGDGVNLVAIVDGGQIYTSGDSGITWTARELSRSWQAVTSSDDGTKLAAVVYTGQIYTSADSGMTWTARDSSRNWNSVASSSDGTRLVATVNSGQIFTSADNGATWIARESSRSWQAVTSSSDGAKLAAVVYTGQVYTSTDSGVTWFARDASRYWNRITGSSDGTKLISTVSGPTPGQVYTSTDSGVTWIARDSARSWNSVSSSGDGAKACAVVYNGLLYCTADSGITWQAKL